MQEVCQVACCSLSVLSVSGAISQSDSVVLVYDAQCPGSLAQIPEILSKLPAKSVALLVANTRG